MLSISPIKSAAHAKSYFMGKDNYYMGDNEGKSFWWGKGAESLGLSGAVKEDVFDSLLKGNLPDGQVIGKMVDGKLIHRPGFDLTFSLPKSVSVLALRSDDSAIYDSIVQSTFKAVEKTLGMVERNCASARVTKNGNTYFVNTGNLVVAMHLHERSREDEADVHIHAVVMNMTQRKGGPWRSLASKQGYYGKNATNEINGFFERVGNQKKQLGAIFRAELAFDLKQKGFPITVTDRAHGFFEVEGISQNLMEAHSTRSLQKEAYMEKHGLTGGDAAALAVQITRPPKSKKSQKVIKQEWLDKEKAKGVDATKETSEVSHVINQIKQGKNNTLGTPQEASLVQARAAVEYVVDLLSETQVKMKPIQLINDSMKNSIGEAVNLESIVKVIEDMQGDGILVPIEQKSGDIYYTTKELLQCEREIIHALAGVVNDKDKISPKDHKKIQASLEKTVSLDKEKKEAIETIFLSENRITALEGESHTGKTSLIKPMAILAKNNGYQPVILTPSKSGSVALQDEIRKSPSRIQQFLKSLFDTNHYSSVSGFIHERTKRLEAGRDISTKCMIFVDNAQLLSLKQMRDLVFITEKMNARLVPIFDKRATLSWQAGNPLQQMLENGMKTATLKNVISGDRHQNIPDAIKDTLAGNVNAAFAKIGNRITEIENKDERMKAMADKYVSLPIHEQKKTQMIMLSRVQCEEMNLTVHQALKKDQQISAIGHEVAVLIPLSMKAAEYRLAENYKIGQWVRFNDQYTSLNVKRGDYLKITAINKKENKVILEHSDLTGKTNKTNKVEWNPFKLTGSSLKVEVFDEKKREISRGDTLLWKRNNREYAITSGEKLKVLDVSSNKLVLEREQGKKVSIDMRSNQNRHFDYGYAVTPNGALNRKTETIIAYQNARSRQSHQRLFYKVLSQAEKDAWIFTENKNELLNNIKQNTGDKITVIDTLIKDDKHILVAATSQKDHIQLLEKAVSTAIDRFRAMQIGVPKTPDSVSKEAVSYALAHLSEREAAFKHRDIMEVALKHILGDANSSHIQDAVVRAEKDGVLVKGAYSSNGTIWTTKEAIDIEREIISLAKADQGKMPALVESSKVEQYLLDVPMKDDHKTAIREWMGATDRIVIVQGDAGTGKTTMLERVEPLLKAVPMLNGEGYQLICLAPTHSVVAELRSRQLTAQTLDGFLSEQKLARMQNEVKKFDGKLIIAVDENSMISNRRERDFMVIAREIGARPILIGDQRQYASIESGKPHTLLQSKSVGIKTIHLNDIVRQKNPVLIKAVAETYQKDFSGAFETLKSHIIEIGEGNWMERLDKMGADYLALPLSERATTGMLTLGNKQRIYLNNVIRDSLKSTGELHGHPLETQVLVSRDMTKVEHSKTANFKLGDIIRFGYSDHYLKIEKGDYLSVDKIHQKENLISLRRQDGEKVIWRPKHQDKERYSGIEVYRHEGREIMSGDLIRWRRTDKDLGLISPDMVKVLSINKDMADIHPVKMTDKGIVSQGKSFEINLNECKYQHWDYAHVLTSYAAQSRGFNNVQADMDSKNRHLASQTAFLILLTRSIDTFTLYTDNKEKLLDKLIQTEGIKTSALETTGEINLSEERKRKTIYLEGMVDKSDPKKVSIARQLARESQPVKGTLAEKYLREHCGISLSNIPSDLRFHAAVLSEKDQSSYPALLAIGRNDKGQIQYVQAIYLDEKTANKVELDDNKMPSSAVGSSVNLSRNIKNKQVTYLAEGVETGLSILQSVDNGNVEVVGGKSNFKRPSLKNMANNVVLCLNNSVGDLSEKGSLDEAAAALSKEGKTVWVAKPNGIKEPKNYNDLLKEQCIKEVKNSIGQAIPYKDYAEKMGVPSVTLKAFLAKPSSEIPSLDDKKINAIVNANHHVNSIKTDQFIKMNGDIPVIQPQLTDRMINKIVDHERVESRKNSQIDENLYRSINKQIHSQEAVKSINRVKDVEIEI